MTAAPYPADTRAKGWRFELDLERVRQSDTWALASPELRPWLFMLWATAWEQSPCGSLPNDEALIVARIGMPPKMWPKARAVLMRGWEAHDDGRLYHATISGLVLSMLAAKGRDKARKAEYRARMSAARDAMSHGTDADATRTDEGRTKESASCDDTGTGTGTGTTLQDKPVGKGRGKRDSATPCPGDVDAQVWADWVALRIRKRSAVSATAVDGARSEAAKAGMTLDAFLRVWCLRGSQGLSADWLKPNERGGAVIPISRQGALEARNAATVQQLLAEDHASQ